MASSVAFLARNDLNVGTTAATAEVQKFCSGASIWKSHLKAEMH